MQFTVLTSTASPWNFGISTGPPPNTAPVAVDDTYTTNEDEALLLGPPGVLGNDTDFDGDPLAAVLESGVTSGTMALNTDGSFTYTPEANFHGSDSFTYYADDGTETSNVVTVLLVVNPEC